MVRYMAVFTALFFVSFSSIAEDYCALLNGTLCKHPATTPVIDWRCMVGQWSKENAKSPDACLAEFESMYDDRIDHVWEITELHYSLYAKNCYSWGCSDTSSYQNVHLYGTNVGDTSNCDDDNFPDGYNSLSNPEMMCLIKTCNDGWFGDPLLYMSDVCARMTPYVPYDKCGETGLNVVTPPLWPDCSLDIADEPPEIPPPEDLDDGYCAPFLSNGYATNFCIVDKNEVCSSSGICPPGCGSIESGGNSYFACFGDNPENWEKPDFDFPEDAEYDPNVAGSCRVINGTSYCPQDEKEHINLDGTYPDGCGYVNNDFYCVSNSIFNNPVSDNADFADNLISTDETDSKTDKILSNINADLRKGFNDLSGDIGELGQGVANGLGAVKNAVEETSIVDQFIADKHNEKLDDLIAGIESLGGETTEKVYTDSVSNNENLFSGVVGDDVVTGIRVKVDTARAEYEQLLTDTKALFNFGSITVADAGYTANLVDLRGVNVDLGAKQLEKFASDFGIKHIIWLCVVLLGLGIIFGARS